MVDTIRWVYHDFPDLRLAVENYVLNDFDPLSFDSMKQLCERYNRAVDNIRSCGLVDSPLTASMPRPLCLS